VMAIGNDQHDIAKLRIEVSQHQRGGLYCCSPCGWRWKAAIAM
jgi:hypothetical protein